METSHITKDPETTVFAGLCELPVVVSYVGVDLTHPGTESPNTCVCLVSIPITDDPCETVKTRDEYGAKSHSITNITTHDEDTVPTCKTADVVKEVGTSVATVVDAVATVHRNEAG